MKLKRNPQEGDERTVSRFLWLPFEIDGDRRWLERVSYLEIYERQGVFDLFGETPLVWKPQFFIDELLETAISEEIKWCEQNKGKSEKGSEFEDGFMAGLRQALFFISKISPTSVSYEEGRNRKNE